MAHSYWRLYIIQSGYGTSRGTAIGLSEVEFRATVGGADQAIGGTATANSEYSGTYAASKAFDDTIGTNWATLESPAVIPGWLQYQFPAPVDVLQISLKART